MAKSTNPAIEMFAAKGAEKVYAAIVSGLRNRIGVSHVLEDPKQTCVHIVACENGTAYAGLHPRKGAVLLNIRMQSPLTSPRIRKVEQLSRNRCHCELVLSSVAEVDDEVIGWLEEAARLVSEG
ncbi:MAG TPA: DUF5655 domain-containing protein [Gemmata sp.]|nr:DUF5655 domain-containing protein [Gemmata sp.]